MSKPGLAEFLDTVWARLREGARDPGAPARLPVLATSGKSGPSARIVVLRGFDPAQKVITFHTHKNSAKIADLETTPVAQVLIWDSQASLQIRLTCDVSATAAPDDLWHAQSEGARLNYASGQLPGAPIPAPGEEIDPPVQDFMTVLTARIREIDVLSLASLPHRRARFHGPEFTGTWIAP